MIKMIKTVASPLHGTRFPWVRALSLAERLAVDTRPPHGAPADPEALSCALGRLADWRSQTPFEQDVWFAQRLLFDGLDEPGLLRLLAEPDDALLSRLPESPAWVDAVEEQLSRSSSAPATALLPQGFFTPLVEGAVEHAVGRVRLAAERLAGEHGAVPFDPRTVASLLATGLPQQLDGILGRTVVLEMQVARLTDQLDGATPDGRFQSFLAALREPERWRDFLAEYPVLARLLVETLDRWVNVSTEILERLSADWPRIVQTFWPGAEPGRLQGLTGGVGDSHAGGRSVRVLQLDGDQRLVYKPRPMGIDNRFSELLGWLNERGAPGLRTAKTLDCGDYGWMEFVPAEPCRTEAELRRFYLRQGAFLALLYVLNANDFHRENLIAAGEHPILIDLESLCSPDYGRSDPATFDSLAQFELNESVMRVMLLPFFHENRDGNVVDLSGLGGGEDQIAAHESLVWQAAGTDEMRLVRQRLRTQGAGNRPIFLGKVVNPLDFRSEIEEGFTAMYRLLLTHRAELLASGSPLDRFRGEEVRIIFRPSQFYGFILRESFHPDLLRDALDRDRHFDRLWFGMDRSHFGELSRRLIRSESEDLWRGDIPCFRARADSRDVRSSLGTHLPELLVRSGFEMIEDRFGRLGEGDLGKQLLFIRNSLMASAMEAGIGLKPYSIHGAATLPNQDGLHRWAGKAAERIEALALRFDGAASWLGLAEISGRGWWLRALDVDLYSGLPGLALFLAYYASVTGEERFTRLAEETLPTLRKRIDLRQRVRSLGAFEGWGGVLHVWTHLAQLWQRPDLLAEALAMVPRMETLADGDAELDLLRGGAGSIVPLLNLSRLTGSEAALAAACRMGDRLVAEAKPFEQGLGWQVKASPLRPLTGFSHGNSGFAWALLGLFAATGEERYRDTALGALDFEHTLFDPEAGNWPDLRGVPLDKTREAKRFMAAWCHGSCGIGLSRLRMLRHLDDPRLLRDARTAVETTSRHGFGWCHAICHGDLGALDLLLEASRTLGDPALEAEIEQRTGLLLASFEEHGFLCGIPGHVETPGLMDGLAGIGYGLLRLIAPDRVPSVLMLDPP
jgi:type 2 lantibiotic biosynthesis protein LanM